MTAMLSLQASFSEHCGGLEAIETLATEDGVGERWAIYARSDVVASR